MGKATFQSELKNLVGRTFILRKAILLDPAGNQIPVRSHRFLDKPAKLIRVTKKYIVFGRDTSWGLSESYLPREGSRFLMINGDLTATSSSGVQLMYEFQDKKYEKRKQRKN